MRADRSRRDFDDDDPELDPEEAEQTEEEEDTLNLPNGGRLRSGAGNRTLFFSAEVGSPPDRLNIGW